MIDKNGLVIWESITSSGRRRAHDDGEHTIRFLVGYTSFHYCLLSIPATIRWTKGVQSSFEGVPTYTWIGRGDSKRSTSNTRIRRRLK